LSNFVMDLNGLSSRPSMRRSPRLAPALGDLPGSGRHASGVAQVAEDHDLAARGLAEGACRDAHPPVHRAALVAPNAKVNLKDVLFGK
jgi:hypothetical protein